MLNVQQLIQGFIRFYIILYGFIWFYMVTFDMSYDLQSINELKEFEKFLI